MHESLEKGEAQAWMADKEPRILATRPPAQFDTCLSHEHSKGRWRLNQPRCSDILHSFIVQTTTCSEKRPVEAQLSDVIRKTAHRRKLQLTREQKLVLVRRARR